MRPPGEVRQALLDAALALTTPERGPTLRELAAYAQVGFDAAGDTVENMCRAGDLVITRKRTVDYRNRPVAEYAVATRAARAQRGPCPLHQIFAGWALASA